MVPQKQLADDAATMQAESTGLPSSFFLLCQRGLRRRCVGCAARSLCGSIERRLAGVWGGLVEEAAAKMRQFAATTMGPLAVCAVVWETVRGIPAVFVAEDNPHTLKGGPGAWEHIVFGTDERPSGLPANIERFQMMLDANNVLEATRKEMWGLTMAKTLGVDPRNRKLRN